MLRAPRQTCSDRNLNAASTNVNVTFTFTAALSASQVTTIASIVANQTSLTVNVIASATTGQTLVLNIQGNSAGIWGRFYYGNGNINSNLFSAQNGALPGTLALRNAVAATDTSLAAVSRTDVTTSGARVAAGFALVLLLLATFL